MDEENAQEGLKLALALTDDEAALLAAIEFHLESYEWLRNGSPGLKLVQSLQSRGAIPSHRWRWLNDPEYNPGGLGASQKDIFERGKPAGSDIPWQACFVPHLRYFLYGPDLPESMIFGFHEKVRSCGLVTSSDVALLGCFARNQILAAGMEIQEAADEFFKLALEYEWGISRALAIRKQILRG